MKFAEFLAGFMALWFGVAMIPASFNAPKEIFPFALIGGAALSACGLRILAGKD